MDVRNQESEGSEMDNRQARTRARKFLNGDLPVEEMEELWIDFLEDPERLERVKTEVNVRELIRKRTPLRKVRGLGSNRQDKHRTVGDSWRSWMLAAAVLLIGWIGYQWSSPAADSMDGVHPLDSIELQVFRSAEPVDGNSTIQEAVSLASRGEHEAAIQLIDQALLAAEDEESRARLTLNAGSILYNMTRFDEALVRFTRVVEMDVQDPMVRERAYWYLGNTYFQMNDLVGARQAFRQTLEMNGAYRRVAERYLNALSA